MSDPYDLQRFLTAQSGGVLEQALSELSSGRKTSHWMWFVLPQLAGLGRSETAVRYAVSGLPEAAAYLAHPVLRERLAACVDALVDLDAGVTAVDVLGEVDAAKLRSSLTLFTAVEDHPAVLDEALGRFFDGPDPATLDLLRGRGATA